VVHTERYKSSFLLTDTYISSLFQLKYYLQFYVHVAFDNSQDTYHIVYS